MPCFAGWSIKMVEISKIVTLWVCDYYFLYLKKILRKFLSHKAAQIGADLTDLLVMSAIQTYEKRDANGILLDYSSLKKHSKRYI